MRAPQPASPAKRPVGRPRKAGRSTAAEAAEQGGKPEARRRAGAKKGTGLASSAADGALQVRCLPHSHVHDNMIHRCAWHVRMLECGELRVLEARSLVGLMASMLTKNVGRSHANPQNPMQQ